MRDDTHTLRPRVHLQMHGCARAAFPGCMFDAFKGLCVPPYNLHAGTPSTMKRGALVRGLGILYRDYYRSLAKRVGKDFRAGALVPIK
jgi:hypothetical protein